MAIKPAISKVVAVDWDARHVRLVLVRLKRSGMEALKAFSQPISPDVKVDDPASLGAFIRDVLDNAGISVKAAVLGIPREKVVVNMLSTPPTPDDELAAMVRFQVTRELPFAAEESTLDFAVCKSAGGAGRDVLWSAIRNDILTYYRDVAAAAGLKLDRIGLRPYANLLAMLPDAPANGADATLLVDIGPEMTEINVIVGGRLHFSRAASVQMPVGNVDPATRVDDSRIFTNPLADVEKLDPVAQSAVDDLLLEVTRSVGAFGATAGGAKIGRIVLAGATGVETAFAAMLSERIGATAELFNPAAVLDLAPTRARQLRGFSAALGLAMSVAREKIEQIDYLNPKKPVTRTAKQMRKAPLAIAAAVTVVAALFFGRQAALGKLENQAAALERQLKEKTKKNEFAKSLKEDGAKIDRWLDPSRVWLDDLVQLSRTMFDNKNRYVTNIIMVADQRLITVNMRTMDTRQTAELAKQLNQLGPYDVKIEPSSEQSGRDGFRFTEKLSIHLRPGYARMAESDEVALALSPRIRAASQPGANDSESSAPRESSPAPSDDPGESPDSRADRSPSPRRGDRKTAEVPEQPPTAAAGDGTSDSNHDNTGDAGDAEQALNGPGINETKPARNQAQPVVPTRDPVRTSREALTPPLDKRPKAPGIDRSKTEAPRESIDPPDTANQPAGDDSPGDAGQAAPASAPFVPRPNPFKTRKVTPGVPPAENATPINPADSHVAADGSDAGPMVANAQADDHSSRTGLVRTPTPQEAVRRGEWAPPPRTKPEQRSAGAGDRGTASSRPSFPRKRSYKFRGSGTGSDISTAGGRP